jgi:hypothetical protein
MMVPMPVPTIFEYYRKHSPSDPSALKAWWVSDKSGPFPFMNYSYHQDYGPKYGANMIQPSSFIRSIASGNCSTSINDDLGMWKNFFDSSVTHNSDIQRTEVYNCEEDNVKIKCFLKTLASELALDGLWNLKSASINNDIINVYSACKILKEFKPELLVVNMQDIDAGHGSFTAYCNNIRIADYGLYKLWQTIQQTWELANDTILIVVPEHGRNKDPNTIRDQYGRYAVDHTGDEISKRIFCLITGPPNVIAQGRIISEEKGSSIDIARTIANILGFDDRMINKFLKGSLLEDAFL